MKRRKKIKERVKQEDSTCYMLFLKWRGFERDGKNGKRGRELE